jgi:hypothetical protein
MPSNEELRRASGRAMEDSRRAGGGAMIERRTGKSVAEDINALFNPPRPHKTLPKVEPVGSQPPKRGTGFYTAPPNTGTGGGIASPVTEPTADTRQYWAGGWPSNDGLLVLPALRRVTMQDANGAEVIFDYADPSV